jgi:hypothetical protein
MITGVSRLPSRTMMPGPRLSGKRCSASHRCYAITPRYPDRGLARSETNAFGSRACTGGTTICYCGTLRSGTLATTGGMLGAVTNDGSSTLIMPTLPASPRSPTTKPLVRRRTTFFFGDNTAGTAMIVNWFGGNTPRHQQRRQRENHKPVRRPRFSAHWVAQI